MISPTNLKSWDAAHLDRRRRTRLHNLLQALDDTAAQRTGDLGDGSLQALRHFMKSRVAKGDTDICSQNYQEYLRTLAVIPDDRWSVFFNEFTANNLQRNDESVSRSLRGLTPDMQRQAYAFQNVFLWRFHEADRDDYYWQKLSKLYRTILSEFPGILSDADDARGALALRDLLRRDEKALTVIWRGASTFDKLEKASELMACAYPDDDTGHMHMAAIDSKCLDGGYHPDLAVDTLICSTRLVEATDWQAAFFVMMHEFQHRRQIRRIESLDQNELSEGSAPYYQARLFSANLRGGYLNLLTRMNVLFGDYLSLNDYLAQPVEIQADDHAYVSTGYQRLCSHGNKTWNWHLSETFRQAVSAAIEPGEHLVSGAGHLWRSAFGSRPAGP